MIIRGRQLFLTFPSKWGGGGGVGGGGGGGGRGNTVPTF